MLVATTGTPSVSPEAIDVADITTFNRCDIGSNSDAGATIATQWDAISVFAEEPTSQRLLELVAA